MSDVFSTIIIFVLFVLPCILIMISPFLGVVGEWFWFFLVYPAMPEWRLPIFIIMLVISGIMLILCVIGAFSTVFTVVAPIGFAVLAVGYIVNIVMLFIFSFIAPAETSTTATPIFGIVTYVVSAVGLGLAVRTKSKKMKRKCITVLGRNVCIGQKKH